MQTHTLMQKYVATVNESIEAHRNEAPWQLFLEASHKLDADLQVQAAIYSSEVDSPHDLFTVGWRNNRLHLDGTGKNEDADVTWKVPAEHLREVTAHPEKYVDQPMQLDLDWLQRRLGLA